MAHCIFLPVIAPEVVGALVVVVVITIFGYEVVGVAVEVVVEGFVPVPKWIVAINPSFETLPSDSNVTNKELLVLEISKLPNFPLSFSNCVD